MASIAISEAAVAIGFSGAAALAISTAGVALLGGAALAFGLIQEVNHLLTPQHSAIGGNAVAFKADPNAGYPLVIGRTGVGGNIVFADTLDDGHNTYLHYITVLSHGPVDAIEGFTANNVPVSFNTDGSVSGPRLRLPRDLQRRHPVQRQRRRQLRRRDLYLRRGRSLGYDPSNSDYWAPAGHLCRVRAGPPRCGSCRRGVLQPDVALPSPAGNVPEWGPANKLSGLCHTRWVLQYDASAYPTGYAETALDSCAAPRSTTPARIRPIRAAPAHSAPAT